MSAPIPPSPLPPWARLEVPTQPAAGGQTLNGNGTINLLFDQVFLVATEGGPYAVVLPDGRPDRAKVLRIYVPGTGTETVTFVVSGTFAKNVASYTFNALGGSLVLEWDGAAWQYIGGDATPSEP